MTNVNVQDAQIGRIGAKLEAREAREKRTNAHLRKGTKFQARLANLTSQPVFDIAGHSDQEKQSDHAVMTRIND